MTSPLKIRVEHARENLAVLTVQFDEAAASARSDWSKSIGEVEAGARREARFDLGSGWTCFFTRRDSENRAFLAHPESDQWVATLSLEPAALRMIADYLARPSASPNSVPFATPAFRLSEHLRLQRISNLDLVLSRGV